MKTKSKEKTYYINIIEGDLVRTKYATQAEIDKLKAEGKEVVVDNEIMIDNEVVADNKVDE